MNNRSDQLYPMMGQFDPSYAVYENSFPRSFSRPSEAPPRFEDLAFWYRPEAQDPIFEHNTMLYHQGMSMAGSPLDQPVGVKHRRTRSGCFTCRHRRVKCDETRPICERCKKGNRECHFPQPSSSSRRTDSSDPRGLNGKNQEGKAETSRPPATMEDESEEGREESVSPVSESSRRIPSRSQVQAAKSSHTHRRYRRGSDLLKKEEESPQSVESTSQCSKTESPVSLTNTPHLAQRKPARSSRWKHLDPVMQQYLQFHHDKITRYHYFLKLDPNEFIHDELIDIALSFEPLLYAIVGFAAYHHTLGKSNGRFQEFWKYYCQSIMLLRKWLENHSDRNEAALLTILQLATFEEYLGDWASVASHQRAAYSIFSTQYTYEDVMATTASRCIFDWLARADVAVGLMAGASTVLERRWFITALEWHRDNADPDELDALSALPCFVAELRLIGYDMATVFANAGSNPNSMRQIRSITKRLDDLRLEIQACHDTACSSRRLPHSDKGDKTADDAFDARVPLFRGDMWPLNFIWFDWYATEQMHKYQSMLFAQAMQTRAQSRTTTALTYTLSESQTLERLPHELEKLSLIQCQIFEAIERAPTAPQGAILGCQASLGLATVFLRKIPKYTTWARRKLANIERMGYVWPPSFRKRMAQIWNDDDVLDWWLPNGESKIDLLDEIREVVEERNRDIEGRGGDERDDVREIKAVFDELDFGRPSNRTRKDSVWSATGTEANRSTKICSTDDSEDSEDDNLDEDDDDDDDDDNEEDSEDEQESLRRRPNRDSGIDAQTSAAVKRGQQHPPPPLEYSNRMSGIWEGPIPGQ